MKQQIHALIFTKTVEFSSKWPL